MLDLLEKELSYHGIVPSSNGMVRLSDGKELTVNKAISLFKEKAKNSFTLVSRLWKDLQVLLDSSIMSDSKSPEGVSNIFIYSIQSLRRMVFLYPGLDNFDIIENSLCNAVCSDIKKFSYRIMSKVIEYKLAIEWVSHILARNLYIKSLLINFMRERVLEREKTAKGVHGPYSNLDLPMQERVFNWSDIDEEVRGKDSDIRKQRRYTMGLEGYNDPYVNEGFVWREIKNEPFLWGKEGENPYPHRNSLWS